MSRTSWLMLALVVLTALSTGRVCGAEFTNWDDDKFLYLNPHLNSPAGPDIGWFWAHSFQQLYIPLTYSVWGALVPLARVQTPDMLGGTLNPWVFHTANFILHLLSVLVVFVLARQMLRRVAAQPVAERASFLGAALFAVHPLQVETVAWACGTKDLLCGVLTLTALWQYFIWAEEATAPTASRQVRVHYVVATCAYAAALLAKPAGVVTPLLAMVLDLMIIGRPPGRVARALLPWALLAAPMILLAKFVQPASNFGATPVLARPLIAGDALAFYLGKLVMPWGLTLDYERPPVYLLKQQSFYFTWLVPAAAAVVIWFWRPGRRWIGAAALLVVAGLLPVLGFVGFAFQSYSTVADHYFYLPMLGVSLTVAWWVVRQPRLVGPIAIILVGLAWMSWRQAGYWQSGEQLYPHALSITPNSVMMHNNYGATLAARAMAEKADRRDGEAQQTFREAEAEFLKALKTDGTDLLAHNNLVTALVREGRPDAAIRHLEPLLVSRSQVSDDQRRHYAPLFALLGKLLVEQGQFSQAVEAFGEVVRQRPEDMSARAALNDARTRLRTMPATTGKAAADGSLW